MKGYSNILAEVLSGGGDHSFADFSQMVEDAGVGLNKIRHGQEERVDLDHSVLIEVQRKLLEVL